MFEAIRMSQYSQEVLLLFATRKAGVVHRLMGVFGVWWVKGRDGVLWIWNDNESQMTIVGCGHSLPSLFIVVSM